MDDETPIDPAEMAHLRFLRLLVTVLTATMIAGLLVLIVLFVTRFPDKTANSAPATATLPLPEAITLPAGTRATAFTQGTDWYAVVTEDNQILIYDRTTGALRQTVTID